jgi:AAA+ superfamily predicted ATPase
MVHNSVLIADHLCNCFSFGLRTTKGVLLHGPPGMGKTSLARLCARDAGVRLFSVNGPEIVSKFYGESEKAFLEVFESASQTAPSMVRFLHSKLLNFSFRSVPYFLRDYCCSVVEVLMDTVVTTKTINCRT